MANLEETLLDNQKTIIGNQADIKDNQKTIIANQDSLLGNQDTIKSNQKSIISNQGDIKGNQKIIVTNQQSLLGNQDTIKDNQKSILSNQKQIVDNQAALDSILQNQAVIMEMLKKLTGKAHSYPLNYNHQFWQNGNHPVFAYTSLVIKQKIDYIHENPVRAGFVGSAYEYWYSSANPKSQLKMIW